MNTCFGASNVTSFLMQFFRWHMVIKNSSLLKNLKKKINEYSTNESKQR